jgi:ABC-type bacteriocin/lantibiotic exporter with double-glycine peptidase domain
VSNQPEPDLRRALRFIVPYWRRLALVLGLSVFSTALSLYLPLLSRDFFDHALIGRDRATLIRVSTLFALVTLLSFAVNVISGLRYTRVSADSLFDMRLEMYRHLQQLSPRFYAEPASATSCRGSITTSARFSGSRRRRRWRGWATRCSWPGRSVCWRGSICASSR